MLNRYLIESPHDADKCDWIMREMLHLGYLYHFDWGCKSDVHTGWGVVEAESEAQAGLVIPQLVRPQARIVRVDRWGPEDFEEEEERK
jgi:hypothetical protein